MDGARSETLSFFYTHVSSVVGVLLGLVFMAHILRQQYRPSVSIAWLLSIIVVPYIALPLYLLIGRRKMPRVARRKREIYPTTEQHPPQPPPRRSRTENILLTAGLPNTCTGNRITLVDDGVEAFHTLLELIREARHSVHLMTYILGWDDVGRAVVKALAEKAREGVQVRLLLDGYGCLFTRGRFVAPLREAGGEVGIFMPVFPLRRKWSANLRNHRKIIVIDGRIGIIGGMNIAREYMGPGPDEKRWVDTKTLVEGPAAADLERIFLSDWNFATNQEIDPPEEHPEPVVEDGRGAVQVAPSGPDVIGDPLHEALLSASYEARQRIWILTPYFIPDEGLFRALMLQARVGRDVRLIVPARSNHILADLTRKRYLRELHDIGGKIYLFDERMMHAKHIVFDDKIAAAGSINIDMRSLYVNYEVAMFMYHTDEIEATAAWIEGIMKRSVPYTPRQSGVFERWVEDLGALISPLL